MSTASNCIDRQFKDFKDDDESSIQKDRFEQIDTKFDMFECQVKDKFENIETKVTTVEQNVTKIEEKQKETNSILGFSPNKPLSSDKMGDMKNFLEYNKQYNKNEERKRIEKKSKKELDQMINLNERMCFRNRNSKSAEKSTLAQPGKKFKLPQRESDNNCNYTTIEKDNVIRHSMQHIKYKKEGKNTFKIPPIKSIQKKYTPKNLGSNVEFISLEPIENQSFI